MGKILKAYKKGEWICLVSILLQIIGIMIINVKHVQSGMGVFSYRVINLISIYVLLGYIAIEVGLKVYNLVTGIKAEGAGYAKSNWVKIAVEFGLILAVVVCAIIGVLKYGSARKNYNLDYNTTNFYFAMAFFGVMLYILAKNVKQGFWANSMYAVAIIPIVFLVMAGVQLSDYMASMAFNAYALLAYLAMFAGILIFVFGKYANFASAGLYLIGSVLMIACGILGGKYNFLNVDMFYWAKLAEIISVALILFFACTMFATQFYRVTKDNHKRILPSLVLFGVAVVLAVVTALVLVKVDARTPAQMHRLDKCYIMLLICSCINLVAVHFRDGFRLENIVMSASLLVAVVVFTILLLIKSKVASFSVFYKFSIISTSVMLGFVVLSGVEWLIRTRHARTVIATDDTSAM